MKCPICHFANTQEAKFCLECGGNLQLYCQGCDKLLSPTARFCDECGRHLEERTLSTVKRVLGWLMSGLRPVQLRLDKWGLSIKPPKDTRILRGSMHMPHGIAVVAITALDIKIGGVGILGALFTWLFIKYEINEDRHIKDQAWVDIVGAMVGIAVGSIMLLVYEILR